MKFTENNGLVKVWVRLVKSNKYKIKDIPELYNLKQIVTELVNKK